MLSKLSNYWTETLPASSQPAPCTAAAADARSDADTSRPRTPRTPWRASDAIEQLMLAPVWIATPLMVVLAASDLLRHV